MTEVELGRMDLGRNQYVVSLELGIFQGRPKSIRPNSEMVKIRPMAQEADSTHFFRPISVHPEKRNNVKNPEKRPKYPKVIEIRLRSGKNKLNWKEINRLKSQTKK